MKRISSILSQKWPEFLIEAIVITASILGAFALDNWNDERKERQKEQALLKQLKQEYETNLQQLDSKIATRNVLIASSKELIYLYDHPEEAQIEDLIVGLSHLGMTVTFDPIENDLISSGNIGLIQNQDLKALLTRWSTDVIQVQEVEVLYLNRYNNQTYPLLIQSGIGRTLDEKFWKSIQSLDFMLNPNEISNTQYGESRFLPSKEVILNHVELEGMVSNSILMNEFINLEAITLRKQLMEILNLLNQEIR